LRLIIERGTPMMAHVSGDIWMMHQQTSSHLKFPPKPIDTSIIIIIQPLKPVNTSIIIKSLVRSKAPDYLSIRVHSSTSPSNDSLLLHNLRVVQVQHRSCNYTHITSTTPRYQPHQKLSAVTHSLSSSITTYPS